MVDLPPVDDDRGGLQDDPRRDMIDRHRVICDRHAAGDDSCAVHSHGTEVDKRCSRVTNERRMDSRSLVAELNDQVAALIEMDGA